MQIAVEYNVIYSSEELDFPEGFVNIVEIREDDRDELFGIDDDHIFNFAISAPFFPKSTRETHRRESDFFDPNILDTEIGGEEIYAVVHHRRNIDGLQSATIESNRIPVAV